MLPEMKSNRWMISIASTGFGKVLPATLLPLISKDGHPYSVPVNIHRSNVMWYSPKVLAAAKVTIPAGGFASWNDFFKACDKIKAAGKVCLSLGPEGFTAMHLFENVMIGTMGAAKWTGLWTTPPTTDWTGADVTAGHCQLPEGPGLHQQRRFDPV